MLIGGLFETRYIFFQGRTYSVSRKKVLLKVNDLKTYFDTEQGLIKAVDGVSFRVGGGEALGIVGESGCGKSVTALSVMQLVPRPRGKIVGGKIYYYKNDNEPIDITALDPYGERIRSLRGDDIAMIFQEPMTSLNPVYTIGQQIMEVIQLHQKVSKIQARKQAIEMLDTVRIPGSKQRIDEYQHQFSGGMRQRAMIAMALSCNPKLLIADEPTTALDVTIEAQILALIKEIQQEFNMSLVIITHDLGVIGEMADQMIVMYMGQVVESASTKEIFQNPIHPYTKALFRSIPRIGRKKRLTPISGSVPNPYLLPKGCCFAPRCSEAFDICKKKNPPTFKIEGDHYVKCCLYGEGGI